MALRDRRMIVTSVVLPLLVTPLMFFGSSWGLKRHQRQLQQLEYHYAIAGPGSERVRELLELTQKRLAAERSSGHTNVFKCKEVPASDPLAALNAGDIHLVLRAFDTPSAQAAANTNAPPARNGSAPRAVRTGEVDSEKPLPGVPIVQITYRADKHESSAAMSRLRSELEETRRLQRADVLRSHGFPLKPAEVASVSEINVASKRQVAGLALGRGLTVLLLLFILSSGAVVAIDSLAGEKERGTLETLLTTSAGRLEILAAKQLVIVAVALVITCIQLGNLLLYIGLKLLPVPPNLAAAVTPGAALVLLLLYLPMAALAANVLLLVSGYARSYKEAQMYFLPVLLVGLVPAMASLLPGIPLRSAIVLVPVANIAVAAREILIGAYDWPMIIASWAVTALGAFWTAKVGVRVLLQEKLVMATETDAAELLGGRKLFERRVLRWFAIMWGVLLILSSYTEGLDLRLQISINLLGLFLCASWLMIRRYRLEPRETLSLRAPRPAVWVGVLAAVPGGFITAVALFQLANILIPAPNDVLENFTGALFPPHVPFYQILFFLSVLPGICEELTFRGVLLDGLRHRMHPVLAVLVVGAVFGVFHVALFRFVPTAALGVMFGAVTLLSGSIFPAMVWHALSNAIGLLGGKAGFPETELDATCYAAGVGLLAVAFYVFWRNRVPRQP